MKSWVAGTILENKDIQYGRQILLEQMPIMCKRFFEVKNKGGHLLEWRFCKCTRWLMPTNAVEFVPNLKKF